jgi:hypothetical protein
MKASAPTAISGMIAAKMGTHSSRLADTCPKKPTQVGSGSSRRVPSQS